ncbi:hypothetical protein M9Y10_005407 [Tritrichomonas musculus]|uniref:Uncharacterized protein n=1 Tax=Tritrichomonas musculus TaxID=1915356 RepID=A0ABR2JLQ4_9EUKA
MRTKTAIQKVRMPAPIETNPRKSVQVHSINVIRHKKTSNNDNNESMNDESYSPNFQSTFPPISNRPLTSLSYSERRECICDIMALGSLRAFDAAHKHHAEDLEKDFEKQWKEQERLRLWRAAQAQSKISTRRKERDKGVLEKIVSLRNQQRREYIERGVNPENVPQYINRRPLPKEDRAIYRKTSPVFYWG